MRKVYLDNLPKDNRYYIDWKNSIDCKVKFVYDDIYGELKIINYSNNKVTIKYKNNIQTISIEQFKRASIGRLVDKYTDKFKFNLNEKINNLVIIDAKKVNCYKYYKYKCNKCGFNCGKHWNIKEEKYKDEYWIEESNLLHGKGCSCCGNKIVVEGINDIPTTAPWMVKYFQGGYEEAKLYAKNSNKKIIPICPECGSIKDKEIIINNINKRHSINCICSDGISYPEKVMFNLLKQLNIDFIYQYSKSNAQWVGKYKYDFYFKLNEEDCIIETHGKQHYKENCFDSSLKKVQENDKNKCQLAIHNGIKPNNYIVIDCRESELDFIKNNIINSRLNEIFDLNNIDWLKIGQDSEKSLIKQVCEYWRIHNNINNENISTKKLELFFKLNRATIIRYLKNGNIIGLCNYDAKEEMKKSGRISGKLLGFKIKVIKDNICLGIFNSASEISRISKKSFGIYLCQSNISKACKLNKKYKGFIFKYMEE